MLQNTERCAGLLENKKEIERFVFFLHFMNDNVFIVVFFSSPNKSGKKGYIFRG